MAKAKTRGPIELISGTIAGWTYVSLHGKQVVRYQAEPSRRTPGQNKQPNRIRLAAEFWRKVLLDPMKKAFYFSLPRVPGQGPYQFAVRDFCNAPVVEEIDVSNYAGHAGEPIRVQAIDDTAVFAVEVSVKDMQGALLEKGAATREDTSNIWTYLATVTVVAGQTVSVSAIASDLPGNSGAKDVLAYCR